MPNGAGSKATSEPATGPAIEPAIEPAIATAIEPMSDSALIARVKAGEVDAFAIVVHRHMRSAFGIAFHVLQHREDAEDVVQQSFIAALTRIDTYDVTRPFGPWFGRVVLNQARSARRARERIARRWTEPADLFDPSPAASPERSAEDSEVRERVQAAVGILPDRQRLAIQLIDIEGYSPAEVGLMLDVAPVTMRWHLMAARRKLRRLLAPLAPRAAMVGVADAARRGPTGYSVRAAGPESREV
jgi:RNA polymerase sigma-70 factor, ECF subfamily